MIVHCKLFNWEKIFLFGQLGIVFKYNQQSFYLIPKTGCPQLGSQARTHCSVKTFCENLATMVRYPILTVDFCSFLSLKKICNLKKELEADVSRDAIRLKPVNSKRTITSVECWKTGSNRRTGFQARLLHTTRYVSALIIKNQVHEVKGVFLGSITNKELVS